MESRHENKKYTVVGSARKDKQWPQVYAIFVVSLASLTYGVILAWTSPFIVKISKDKINYDITEEEASYFAVIPPLSMMISSIFVSKLNDIIGRKRTIMLVAIPQLAFWIITMIARDVKLFYFARFICGIGDAFFFACFPMYIGEISTPKIRGSFGNINMIAVYGGQFLINVVGMFYSVKMTACILLPIPIIFLILLMFAPESPYYYIIKGKDKEAKKALMFLKWKKDIDEDYINLRNDVERQISERGTWKDLVKIQSNRRALTAALFLRISQLFTGAAVWNFYTLFIFKKSGANISPELSTLLFSGLLFALTVVVAFTTDMIGRKKSYMGSIFTSGIILLLLAIYFYLDQETSVDVSCIRWFPVALMLLFIVSSSVGVSIIPTLMLGELFSASIKAKGLTICTITIAVFMFITNNLFYLIDKSFGLYAPFLLFSICCFVSTILCNYVVPETKGKTLEEIQQDLKKGFA